jgi:hypothetical protein
MGGFIAFEIYAIRVFISIRRPTPRVSVNQRGTTYMRMLTGWSSESEVAKEKGSILPDFTRQFPESIFQVLRNKDQLFYVECACRLFDSFTASSLRRVRREVPT